MDLVSAGQTRRRQGLLSLSRGLALFLLSLLFLEEWGTSGKEEEYGLCFFLSFFLILSKSILGWKWVELLEM